MTPTDHAQGAARRRLLGQYHTPDEVVHLALDLLEAILPAARGRSCGRRWTGVWSEPSTVWGWTRTPRPQQRGTTCALGEPP